MTPEAKEFLQFFLDNFRWRCSGGENRIVVEAVFSNEDQQRYQKGIRELERLILIKEKPQEKILI